MHPNTTSSFWRHAVLATVGVVGFACTGRTASGAAETDAAGASSGTATSMGGEGTLSPPADDDGGDLPPPTGDTGDDTSTDEGGGVSFMTTPDGGGLGTECDIFEQDCAPGLKCMPYSNDGGPAWNATACFPIARDPVGYGESCQVEGNGVSGIDDCDAGMMCWNVDENNIGYCVHMCTGSADNPTCPLRDEQCSISSSGVLLICQPTCDPLADDCEIRNEVCYPSFHEWICAPDASGESGTFGDPCEFINACDPLHVCINAEAFSECAGAIGCCTQVCNVFAETADADCAALDPGMACEGWWIEGQAPPGYEHVGVCALPR